MKTADLYIRKLCWMSIPVVLHIQSVCFRFAVCGKGLTQVNAFESTVLFRDKVENILGKVETAVVE